MLIIFKPLTTLAHIVRKLNHIIKGIGIMSQQLEALTQAVAAERTVIQSAVVLLGSLKSKLDDAIAKLPEDDGAALQDLATELGSQTSALASAVAANTPADPAPAASPAPADPAPTA